MKTPAKMKPQYEPPFAKNVYDQDEAAPLQDEALPFSEPEIEREESKQEPVKEDPAAKMKKQRDEERRKMRQEMERRAQKLNN